MRRWLETGLAERVRAPKWSVRRADTSLSHPNTEQCDRQTDVRRFRAITGAETAVHQLSRTHERALGRARLLLLLLEHFFDLSDLFLNFAGVFFDVAFGL